MHHHMNAVLIIFLSFYILIVRRVFFFSRRVKLGETGKRGVCFVGRVVWEKSMKMESVLVK